MARQPSSKADSGIFLGLRSPLPVRRNTNPAFYMGASGSGASAKGSAAGSGAGTPWNNPMRQPASDSRGSVSGTRSTQSMGGAPLATGESPGSSVVSPRYSAILGDE